MSRKTVLMSALMGAVLMGVVGCVSVQLSEFEVGEDLQKDGNYDEAITHYQAHIAAGEGILLGLAQLRIARCHEGAGRDNAALRAYQQVIDKYGDKEAAGMAGEEMEILKEKMAAPKEDTEGKAVKRPKALVTWH